MKYVLSNAKLVIQREKRVNQREDMSSNANTWYTGGANVHFFH